MIGLLSSLLSEKILAPVAGVLLAAGVVLGAYWWGSHTGASRVQAQWDLAKATQSAREDAVAKTVTSLSERLVAAYTTKLDGLDHQQEEAIHAAKEADVAPVDERCRDVRRGVPSGVVRSLDAIR